MTEDYGRHLSFPFRIGKDGRTVRVSSVKDHVREELIQLILTNLGERVFLPEFGGGVRRLVFENADPTTEGMTKATLTQAISRWLGHRITIEDLTVTVETETIEVEIKYRIAGTEDIRVMRFQRSGG
ncbi:MAG: GPW/gp25 family protein [Candidatus Bipolaricaulia bacterium]